MVDYGIVNLANIERALVRVGAEVSVSNDPEVIRQAQRIVLPGVGAFATGMAELSARCLDQAVVEVAARGAPMMGICLGMQMLLDYSEENGFHKGLGLISGSVKAIPKNVNEHGDRRKVPHIGWNSLNHSLLNRSWRNTCLSQVKPGDYCYFVHSFMAIPDDEQHILASSEYELLSIVAAIQRENIIGLQFHPERSGPVGLKMLHCFVSA